MNKREREREKGAEVGDGFSVCGKGQSGGVMDVEGSLHLATLYFHVSFYSAPTTPFPFNASLSYNACFLPTQQPLPSAPIIYTLHDIYSFLKIN